MVFTSVCKKTKINEDKPTLCFSTSVLGPGSLHLKSRISRLIKTYYPGYKSWIKLSTPRHISHFFLFKDSIPITHTLLCSLLL